jgi:hypothetical protein
LLEGFAGDGKVATSGRSQWGGGVALGREIETDRLPLFPVGRNLENGGAAKSTMGEKHLFAEGIFCDGGNDFRGDASEFRVAMMIGAIEDERNEGGARRDDFVAELASEVVAEGSGSHFGDGEATGGDDQNGGAEFGGIGMEEKLRGAFYFRDAGVEEDLDSGGTAFGFEKAGDVGRRIVAEELAERFFVVGDAMFLDENEKIVGRETGESGFGEVWVSGEEIFWRGVNVGEIATATAGDKDFFADAVGMFD